MLTREKVLSELLFALRGVQTKTFEFETSEDLAISNEVPRSLVTVLPPIIETCLLFRTVNEYASAKFIPNFGFQAIASAFRDFMPAYFSVISSLEAELEKSNLTFVHLQSSLLSPNSVLKLFNSIIKLGDKAPSFLNVAYSFTDHGDPLIRTYAKEIYAKVREPYMKIMDSWENEGSLSLDTYNEFFIRPVEGSDSPNGATFVIFEDKIPLEFTKDQVRRIFNRGCAMYFIRNHCNDPLFNGRESTYEEVLGYARTQLLISQKLIVHLRAIRNYVLLSSGAFVDSLLRDGSEEYLFKAASSSSVFDVNAFVLEVLADLEMTNEDREVIQRIDGSINYFETASQSENSHKQLWELFMGKYDIENSAVSFIVEKNALQKYRKCFMTLWRLRLSVKLINDAYRSIKFLHSQRDELPQMLATFEYISKRLLDFQQRVYLELIMVNWESLKSQLHEETRSLQQISEAHADYLGNIFSVLGSSELFRALHSITLIVLRFRSRLSTENVEFEEDEFLRIQASAEEFFGHLV